MELWKDIKDYEGYYQISNTGMVRNTRSGKILSGDTNSLGYHRVCLYSPVRKRFFVHRLVALHFVDGYKDGLVVNHKDGNKSNNNAANLEWVTRSENDLHAFRTGLRCVHPCTFKHQIAKIDKHTMDIICVYENTEACSRDLKVRRPNIYACCNGKQKTCRGFILKYV